MFHSIRVTVFALVAGATASSVAAQTPPAPVAPGAAASFTIFVRAVPVGSEQISIVREADGWVISSSGRIGAPLDVVARRLQVRYDAQWRPIDLLVDATVRGQVLSLHTTVSGTTAKTDMVTGTQSAQRTDTIAPDAILLPSPFFGPYEALAARVQAATEGSVIGGYAVPQPPFTIRVGHTSDEQIQTARELIQARRTHLTLDTPGLPMDAEIWADSTGRLLRFSVPAQALEVVREDIASVAARRVTVSRPNDEPIKIAATGFSLAGTISKPAASGQPLPSVILLGGSGPTDRDETVFGIPILGQLAGALADAGFLVLRYDKRGVGQSGGRLDSASLVDFSEDARLAVRYLADRKDVDPKRIALAGHSEGGAVAMLAAARERGVAALVLISTNAVTGADLILAQQQHALHRTKLSDTEKQAKIDLQKRIHEVVITGKGWDTLPADVRRQVDNPWFQSLLTFDPAKVMSGVRQPLLIVQGELDTQVEPSNADGLQALAAARKNRPRVDVVKVPGVNHLLVPATTGEVDEYATLKDRRISPILTGSIVTWLQKTLAAPPGKP